MSAVNLKQLAAHLGLTASTVSRALNNYKDISPETRKRVQEAAKALNYRPSRVAQQLARGKLRVDTIAYVMPAGIHRFSDPMFASFIVGVGDTLANAERDLLITSPSKNTTELETYERIIAENKANAFIISRTTPDDERIKLLKKHNIPFVCHGRTQHANDFHWYDADVLEGAKLVAKRFIAQGRKRLGLITPPPAFNFSRLFIEGFQEVTNTTSDVSVTMGEGDMSESSGFEITTQWLANEVHPEAIFCGSDAMAVGAMQAIKQHGLAVGADIAVIGYGDFPVASYVSPALTTLQQPLHDAGEQVTNMLLALLEKPDKEPSNVLVPLSLIERESDIKPNSVKKG
ncbi:LacI family transcriptional regulator [Leucothrix sargassi]|nr:LacI family transcriptional regulator [Leucothrix sargassi]